MAIDKHKEANRKRALAFQRAMQELRERHRPEFEGLLEEHRTVLGLPAATRKYTGNQMMGFRKRWERGSVEDRTP